MKDRKFRLLTDMDDVMENLLPCWLELLKFLQRNNPDYIHKTPDEITDWDITKFFPMLTVDEVFKPLNTPIIWDMIRPIEGAVETLEFFNSMPEIDVRVVTNSHYTSIHYKREFLRKFFPFIKWNQIIITAEKQFIDGDVLIDDNISNLIGGKYQGLLFAAPHNKKYEDKTPDGIIRVSGWDKGTHNVKHEVLKMFDEFKNYSEWKGAKNELFNYFKDIKLNIKGGVFK